MKTFTDFFDEAKNKNEFYIEGVKLDFAKQIETLLDRLKLSRKDLADRLGKSKPYVTKFMRGDTNFTLESMVAIARALDGELVSPKIEHPCLQETEQIWSSHKIKLHHKIQLLGEVNFEPVLAEEFELDDTVLRVTDKRGGYGVYH